MATKTAKATKTKAFRANAETIAFLLPLVDAHLEALAANGTRTPEYAFALNVYANMVKLVAPSGA